MAGGGSEHIYPSIGGSPGSSATIDYGPRGTPEGPWGLSRDSCSLLQGLTHMPDWATSLWDLRHGPDAPPRTSRHRLTPTLPLRSLLAACCRPDCPSCQAASILRLMAGGKACSPHLLTGAPGTLQRGWRVLAAALFSSCLTHVPGSAVSFWDPRRQAPRSWPARCCLLSAPPPCLPRGCHPGCLSHRGASDLSRVWKPLTSLPHLGCRRPGTAVSRAPCQWRPATILDATCSVSLCCTPAPWGSVFRFRLSKGVTGSPCTCPAREKGAA
ncbi:hypothetical protein NDU88_000775 [Pleurodeles waltl]|uniref:Uncharacterized protein n=1 Tax=Pleurodeles waltl TaxID=8319 RepID=A0AAV7VUH7_PLEWA|nr:hypothetical protein NDU88_000775 [Pleurodeles waltl]